jgi:hypothetical protein
MLAVLPVIYSGLNVFPLGELMDSNLGWFTCRKGCWPKYSYINVLPPAVYSLHLHMYIYCTL